MLKRFLTATLIFSLTVCISSTLVWAGTTFTPDTNGTLKDLLKGYWTLEEASGERVEGWGERFAKDTNDTLSTNLVAYWPLDKNGATRFDERSGTTSLGLTDFNNTDSAAGKQAKAAQFTKASSMRLRGPSASELNTGDIDFSISCWVFLDTKTSTMTFVSKHDSASVREYELAYALGNDRFQFDIFDSSGTTVGTALANNFGIPSTGVFIFIVAWHDSVTNTVNIQVNNGTVNSVATTGVPSVTSALFTIGAVNDPATFMDGRIDEVGFWKKVLTTQERADLFNDGNANTYTRKLRLADNSTVTQAVGKKNNAAQFTAANSEFLSIAGGSPVNHQGTAYGSALLTEDIDWTISAWIFLDSKPGNNMTIISKRDSNTDREYDLVWDNVTDQFIFTIYNASGSSVGTINATTFGSPSLSTFVFIQAYHDSVNNEVGISINGGTINTASTTGFSVDRQSTFRVGAFGDTPSNFWDGRIDEVGYWKKRLTTQEISDLFNAGAGNTLGEVLAIQGQAIIIKF